MSTKTGILSPPEHVRGMTLLDRDRFKKTIAVPCLEVDHMNLDIVVKCVKSIMLKMRSLNPIIECDDKKLILLNPEIVSSFDDIDDNIKEILKNNCKMNDQLMTKEIEIGYDNFDFHHIFESVLPKDQMGVSGFSSIGHILHLNLRDHILPFKHFVGEVFIDKVKSAKMVINKLDIIENEFRNFNMEIIAKKSDEDIDTIVKLKENGLSFEFDFSKVYWNPRLGTEHERIVSKLRPDIDVLYDVFAGVGPFAIPAAKRRKCHVIANDLNPDCYKWLQHNAKLNKIDDLVTSHNIDGRDFIKTIVRNDLLNRWKLIDLNEDPKYIPRFHIVMNLPAIAFEFLDVFKGLFNENELISTKLIPLIHCYCFVRDEPSNYEIAIKEMVQKILQHPIDNIEEIVNIRHVAPNKDMFRISFTPPQSVLCIDSNQSAVKRQRVE